MISKDISKLSDNNNFYQPVTISFEDFIGCLAELEGSYGENRFTKKIIRLLKRKLETKEEIEQIQKPMYKALQQLMSFDHQKRSFFIERYQSSVKDIVEELYKDWNPISKSFQES